MKKCLCLLLILMLLPCSAVFAEDTEPPAELLASSPLPIDFSPGRPVDVSRYGKDLMSYEDPSIRVTVTEGRVEGRGWGCDWWMADIEIADASQLRTYSASDFQNDGAAEGERLSKRANAVVAINGDYFCYTRKGYILRQGVLIENNLQGDRDVLLIDEDGDFHIVPLAKKDSIDGTVDGKKVINAFYFGPALVADGEVVVDPTGQDMAEEKGRQRMCIAQVGPLHYKAICCAGPWRGSDGLTLKQFAELVYEQGVQVAYNLDGGDSTMLFMNHTKINSKANTTTRKITDILYFASAWEGD